MSMYSSITPRSKWNGSENNVHKQLSLSSAFQSCWANRPCQCMQPCAEMGVSKGIGNLQSSSVTSLQWYMCPISRIVPGSMRSRTANCVSGTQAHCTMAQKSPKHVKCAEFKHLRWIQLAGRHLGDCCKFIPGKLCLAVCHRRIASQREALWSDAIWKL